MAMKLWGMYDGEPFMENPRLGILSVLNPHRRGKSKKGKKMARKRSRKGRMPAGLRRYWATHRRGKKANPRRRRRARKNWVSPGIVAAANPRRRHHRRRHHYKMNRRRHHYRRNPAFLGLDIPPIKTVIFAGVGFAGPSFVQGFLTQMAPSLVQQVTSFGIIGKYAMKIGLIAGISYVTRRFVGSSEANAVAIGGGLNVAMSLVNDFAPGFLPANPLSMYIPTAPGLRGMQAYVPTRPGLRAVPGATHRAMATTAIPTPAPFRKLHTSGPFGSALRYQRY